MNVGDIVIVTRLGDYNPTYAESTPFVGKIFMKDAVNYWVRSEATNKEYELYEDQISPLAHFEINKDYDGTNSYYIASEDYMTGLTKAVWDATKPKLDTDKPPIIVGTVPGYTYEEAGPFPEKLLFHIWLEGKAEFEPKYLASIPATTFLEAIHMLKAEGDYLLNLIEIDGDEAFLFNCKLYSGVSPTNQTKV